MIQQLLYIINRFYLSNRIKFILITVKDKCAADCDSVHIYCFAFVKYCSESESVEQTHIRVRGQIQDSAFSHT